MLYSRLYKNYYPLGTEQDIRNMNYKDRQELSRLIQEFENEIKTNPERLIKRGYGKMKLNEIGNFAFELIKEKLEVRERLTDQEMNVVLDVLNVIIFRNKFVPALSRCICPKLGECSAK